MHPSATVSDSQPVSPGTVFISYSRDDRNRIEPIVKCLTGADFPVWWDRDIALGTSFRSAIENSLDEAACVLVFWSTNSVNSQFVWSEASRGQDKGILVPVLLDSTARIPVGFTELHHLDLTSWDQTDAQLHPLIDRVQALVSRGPSKNRYQSTLANGDWVVQQSTSIVSELRGLTAQIRSVGDLLIGDSQAVKDLRGALGEVSRTYQVVESAVLQFVAPAIGNGPIDAQPFLKLERGSLKTQIEKGRGHCGLILTYYGRFGGLRDCVQRVAPHELQKFDDAFARLGTADGDLFTPLIQIGEILSNESRVIVSLLVCGQEEAARKRIRDGRVKLAPLEDQLTDAMKELQDSQAALGYSESV
jgi:hypothetical protein